MTLCRKLFLMKFYCRTKEVIEEIKFPVPQVTSVAFGGPKLDTLYVTTANRDGKQPEGSGLLYKVTELSASGYPGTRANLC